MDKKQIDELLTRHLQVWSENDAKIRKVLIQEIYALDVEVVDPFSIITGQESLNDFITGLQSKNPGYQFSFANAIDSHNHIARLNWQYGPPESPAMITGQDIFVIGAARIERLFIFVDGPNALDPH
jgi:hypothetical protein